MMLVVLSTDLLQNEECKLCIRDCISTGHSTAYIVREELKEVCSDHKDIYVAVRTSRRVMWLTESDDVIRNGIKYHCQKVHGPNFSKRKLQSHLLSMLEG